MSGWGRVGKKRIGQVAVEMRRFAFASPFPLWKFVVAVLHFVVWLNEKLQYLLGGGAVAVVGDVAAGGGAAGGGEDAAGGGAG